MQIKKEKTPEEKLSALEPLLLNSEQAAKVLGVSVRYLFTLRKSGVIYSKQLGGKLLYSVEMLKAFANGESVERWNTTAE